MHRADRVSGGVQNRVKLQRRLENEERKKEGREADMQIFRYSDMQVCRCAGVPMSIKQLSDGDVQRKRSEGMLVLPLFLYFSFCSIFCTLLFSLERSCCVCHFILI
mmetsp:Transcript_6735/g.16911  ORF Transcript_6735/g.16911 Transcript_6735/m.16911 type:complete len:106 (-) Transcript_6735:53-370(-)